MWPLTFFENASPEKAWGRRVLFDKLLALSLSLAMAGFLTGNLAHEVLSLILTLALITHLALNRFWCKRKIQALFGVGTRRLKGKDYALLALNTALAFTFTCTIVTGVLGSQSIFLVISEKLYGSILTIRYLHTGFASWFFLLAGIHIGFHASVFFPKVGSALQKIFGNKGFSLFLIALGIASLFYLAGFTTRREALYLLDFELITIPMQRGESSLALLADLALFEAAIALLTGLALNVMGRFKTQ